MTELDIMKDGLEMLAGAVRAPVRARSDLRGPRFYIEGTPLEAGVELDMTWEHSIRYTLIKQALRMLEDRLVAHWTLSQDDEAERQLRKVVCRPTT